MKVKLNIFSPLLRQSSAPVFEIHISRGARDRYNFDHFLFATDGEVIFKDFKAVRYFTKKLIQIDNKEKPFEQSILRQSSAQVYASDIYAMGLIHEILHHVISQYKKQKNPIVFQNALEYINGKHEREDLDNIFLEFIEQFPPVNVYNKNINAQEYLEGQTGGVTNREIILEELVLLLLENTSPAFLPYQQLFDDTHLQKKTDYRKVIDELKIFFDRQPVFGPDSQNLLEMLRTPAIVIPNSLQGQLQYIRDRWGYLLGDYINRLLRGLDFLDEEKKSRGFGPGEIQVLEFNGEEEYERYSPDIEWMTNVVMIAKHIYVWLDQLSKKYQRSITRLNDIPDEELDRLAEYGFIALWLIGIWERSLASKEIKRMCGNPEAEASAYSLLNYDISHDIGGWEALKNLRERCWQRGIRLASDMVPNHTGIDSKWVIEHPDWFISLDHSPFPSYTFEGRNLSNDNRVEIYLEDHYYSRGDAAVVFKRVDHWTRNEKYIYHGNDGTSMPWNDTAQLDFLNPDVREAVIQTILHVVRNFPIIRFDAAMTLSKKHYQRLWFPEPGTGSDIPSRAEYGVSRKEFRENMPGEFWREVVDRVNAEVPDTLLLAEAFWLMEGYFVRTLGMHRVYNSAFMNMLKMEENAKYRQTIKNTLEFDPEILKRFVNFLNNPDEETAAKQFGKGDKYFGVTMMMVTMPGLPMFGHGQIEGFEEKYGMEYRRAYWDEYPAEWLIQRHIDEIFPVIKKRYLFSEVKNFLLYDFYETNGPVNENVFAYSNRYGGEQALILYNNAYEPASGWVRISAAYNDKQASNEHRYLKQKNLGEGLDLTNSPNHFTIFREHISGLEFIRRSEDLCEKGLYAELDGYQYQVFWEFREVGDNEFHHYEKLYNSLSGKGVPSIAEAMKKVSTRQMDVLFLAAEVSPFSKAGGLADVAGSLPQELVNNGKSTTVISPLYSHVNLEKFNIHPYPVKGAIKMGDMTYLYEIYYKDSSPNEPEYFFVQNNHFFNRSGIYVDTNGEGFPDNNARFFFFQYVILDLIRKGYFSPDLIHCNDHHTALLPWMLQNHQIKIPAILTVHNFQYQGWFSKEESALLETVDRDNLDKRKKVYDSLQIGITSADWINTVSPEYVHELQKDESLSFGLYTYIKANRARFSGILNGVDYSTWNPETDPFLENPYSKDSLEGKRVNKKILLKECGFSDDLDIPVIGMISRLVESKGYDLVLGILDKIIQTGTRVVFLGIGDSTIADALQKRGKKYPENICYFPHFDEKMAHRIEAGSDMFLMPSRFEPCGLNQIYSLRYGTIPIVHFTGGLADTVANWDGKMGTGFIFKTYSESALFRTVLRALRLYRKKREWKALMINAMKQNFSWHRSARQYIKLYNNILGDMYE
ncbi:MAG: glycogen/starch synthase [Candidatus Marinimicrobia bacterium]|nr:glycogen/starch synthase [Candidatus Neomarinimicrobiota bacterium]